MATITTDTVMKRGMAPEIKKNVRYTCNITCDEKHSHVLLAPLFFCSLFYILKIDKVDAVMK